MGRHSCCYKQKLRKGLWSPEEDEKLVKHITRYGHGCWSSVPKLAGLQRCGKSCRLRWTNYLRPDLKRGSFSKEEEDLIIELHSVLGNRWSQIAAQLQGRTDNEIKNLWNSSIRKKLRHKGIDPSTHKPLSKVESTGQQEKAAAKDKASQGSSEFSFDNSGSHGGLPSSSSAPDLAETNTYHEFLLNKLVGKSTDLSGFISFKNLNYGPNVGLPTIADADPFFSPNHTATTSEITVSMPDHLTIPSPVNLPSMPGPTGIKPVSFAPDNPLVKFETSYAFLWTTPADCNNTTKAEKDLFMEDIKWADYLQRQAPFVLGNNDVHNPNFQNNHHMFGELKSLPPQPQFSIDGTLNTAANWHHQNQQQSQSLLQTTEVYNKHFQRLLGAPFQQFS